MKSLFGYSLAVFVIGALCTIGAPAMAHPHILATVRATIVYSDAGAPVSLRQQWTYDQAYSAFAMREASKGEPKAEAEALAQLAKTQASALAEFGYYTKIVADGKPVALGEAGESSLERGADGRLTISFTLPFKSPGAPAENLSIEIFDPVFFAYFTMDNDNAVQLSGASAACVTKFAGPQPLDLKNTRSVPAIFWAALDGSASAGQNFVNRIDVACPSSK
jgi:ABC-type uncharacterized transport system substrate-binding protein